MGNIRGARARRVDRRPAINAACSRDALTGPRPVWADSAETGASHIRVKSPKRVSRVVAIAAAEQLRVGAMARVRISRSEAETVKRMGSMASSNAGIVPV
jgi:hypothetical protein